MSDIQASLQNAFETELTATMGINDTVAEVSTIGTLSAPSYLVIDPDSDTLREYILFDVAFIATEFRTTTAAENTHRYLAGSAQASGLAHSIGAKVRVVPMAQHFDDLHDRINAVDHGGITGLGDDDHTQYVRVDGARAFTAAVGGVDPVASADLATMNYVDTEIGAIDFDHGTLDGLADDDHPQYLTEARGNTFYSLLGHTHTYLPLAGGTVTGALTVNGDLITTDIFLGGDGRIFGEANDYLKIGADELFKFVVDDVYVASIGATGLWLNGGQLRFQGDDWIQSYEAFNAMQFGIDGIERMRLTSAGYLHLSGGYIYMDGIADTDYLQMSDASNWFRIVQGGAETHRFDGDGDLHIAGNRIYLDTIGGNEYLYMSDASNYFAIVQDGVEGLRLDSSGRLSHTKPEAWDVYNTAAQSVPDSAWTNMVFNSERSDVYGRVSGAVYTCQTAGFYVFGCTARMNSDTYDWKIQVNHSGGASYECQQEPIDGAFGEVMGMRYMAAGETLTAKIWQNWTGPSSTYANSVRFYGARIS